MDDPVDVLGVWDAAKVRKPSPWRPIETAPEDTRVLVCDASDDPDDFEVVVAIKTDRHAGHLPNDERIWADWAAGMDEDDVWRTVEFHPTHWMPLPTPP